MTETVDHKNKKDTFFAQDVLNKHIAQPVYDGFICAECSKSHPCDAFLLATIVMEITKYCDDLEKPIERTKDASKLIEEHLIREWHQNQCACVQFDGHDMATCYLNRENPYHLTSPLSWTADEVLLAVSEVCLVENVALLTDRDRLATIVSNVKAHCESERTKIRAKYEAGVAYHSYANACDDILAIAKEEKS